MSAEARAVTGRAQPLARVAKLSESACLRVGGIGARAARLSCDALAEAGAGALLSIGCAAGLAKEAAPGTLVLPREMRAVEGQVFRADPEWRQALLEALAGEFSPLGGDIVGVNRVVGSSDKRILRERTGAIAADMESVTVAQEAERRGLPMVALRVISDAASDDVPEAIITAVDDFGRPRYGALLAALVKSPRDAVAVSSLRKGFRQACGTLSRIAAIAGPAFCCPEGAGNG
ncbi:MAG: hypothetical protein R3337_05245 [Gammaproteobacteria bacterium]|nr:hypothetical protein [Gammaproteobacteria bacterium]